MFGTIGITVHWDAFRKKWRLIDLLLWQYPNNVPPMTRLNDILPQLTLCRWWCC